MQLVDWRVEFSRWWVNEFKTVKFPSHGTVFDYYIDTETKKFEPWSKRVPTFELDPEVPLQASANSFLFVVAPSENMQFLLVICKTDHYSKQVCV